MFCIICEIRFEKQKHRCTTCPMSICSDCYLNKYRTQCDDCYKVYGKLYDTNKYKYPCGEYLELYDRCKTCPMRFCKSCFIDNKTEQCKDCCKIY